MALCTITSPMSPCRGPDGTIKSCWKSIQMTTWESDLSWLCLGSTLRDTSICLLQNLSPAGRVYSEAPSPQRRGGSIVICKALAIKAKDVRGLGDSEVRHAICSVCWVGFSRPGLGRQRVSGEVGMRRKTRRGKGPESIGLFDYPLSTCPRKKTEANWREKSLDLLKLMTLLCDKCVMKFPLLSWCKIKCMGNIIPVAATTK